ncbi:unnamed protein product [Allacma fusca]|uniref:Uncharacterized protein n=1 Tax=Allacma fusca TaxID=39272 RepID=A0A8J2KZP0_9HEXA|nr:unnamed protein product [Allacma fusca]
MKIERAPFVPWKENKSKSGSSFEPNQATRGVPLERIYPTRLNSSTTQLSPEETRVPKITRFHRVTPRSPGISCVVKPTEHLVSFIIHQNLVKEKPGGEGKTGELKNKKEM